MLHRFALAIAVVVLIAGCGSNAGPTASAIASATAGATATASATATPSPTPTASPTPSPSPSSATIDPGDPFAGQPYALDLPAGWDVLDFNATTSAAFDAFTKANPGLAGAIDAFRSLPSARLFTNTLLGDALIGLSLPSQGLPLDTIGQSLTAQFQNVHGVTSKPVAKKLTLPAGPALHWAIEVSGNKVGGGTARVSESIYLVTSGDFAILVEFVAPHGGVTPGEASIIKTLRIQP